MPPLDAAGKDAQQRFEEIREFFLELLAKSGQSRKELYYRPKPGDAREPTEEEVVRRWAAATNVSVHWICFGIQSAFEKAGELNAVVTSFRYCVPHITACCERQARQARTIL